MEFPKRLTTLELGSDAHVTGSSVLTNEPRHLWPPVVSRNQFQSLEPSWVSSNEGVMVLLYNAPAEIFVIRNIDLASENKQTIVVRPLCIVNTPMALILVQCLGSFSNGFLQGSIAYTVSDITQDIALLSINP